MKINIPTGQDISRDISIQYVSNTFVYITDCNPPLILKYALNKQRQPFMFEHYEVIKRHILVQNPFW